MATQLHSEPDSDLLKAHLAGDPNAFAALYARYRVQCYAYLLRRCGRTRADGSFRATWHAAATGETLDVHKDFVAQLFGLAHAEVLRAAPDELLTPDSTLPELTQRTRQRAQRFERSLRLVPSDAREAYLLYEEGGLTLAEVGGILDVEPEVVRELIRRALTELRSGLDAEAADFTVLHDPRVAVAHLAARRTPPPPLDAVVLEDVRRVAESIAERRRVTGDRRRFWPFALLMLGGVALAQATVYWSSREPAPRPIEIAPMLPPIAEPSPPQAATPQSAPPKPAAPAKRTKQPKPVVVKSPAAPTVDETAPALSVDPVTDDAASSPPSTNQPLIDTPPSLLAPAPPTAAPAPPPPTPR